MQDYIEKKKYSAIFLLSMIGLMIVMIIASVVIVKHSHATMNAEVDKNLQQASIQTSAKVEEKIENHIEIIDSISRNLSLLETEPAMRAQYFENIEGKTPFEWVGIAKTNGVLSMEGYAALNLSEYSAVKNALKGKSGVNDRPVPGFDGREGIFYASPYVVNNKTTGVAVGWIPAEDVYGFWITQSFEGDGAVYIIDKKGDMITGSSGEMLATEKNNIFSTIKNRGECFNGTSLDKMKKDITEGKGGKLYVSIKDDNKYAMYYTPINHGNWYFLSSVPMELYTERVMGLVKSILIFVTVIFALFLLLIGGILYINRKNYKRMQVLAYEDGVTGGFSPQKFDLEFKRLMKRFVPFAFISIDIRRFKLINDTFGSSRGDIILQHVHNCISRELKGNEFVARIAADAFDVVMHTTNKKEIQLRLERIAETINSFNERRKIPYLIDIDCGIFLVNTPELDIITIRDRANAARKSNRESGGTKHCKCVFYEEFDRLRMLREKALENMAERALERNEFEVFLQPKVDLETEEIVSAEALSRWNSPEKGLLLPNEYIPLFERNGFIDKLDLYVFEKVCAIMRKWMDEGRREITISFNVSRKQLHMIEFLERFETIRKRYGVPSKLLEFELTETLVFENLELLKDKIEEIHRAGFKCSMDDFGSGYSSLNVLKEIPVDVLKLDQRFFVAQNDTRGMNIVEMVIQLAKKLNVVTVAEGVKTAEQLEFLKQAGCNMVQSYLFSKPVQIAEFEEKAFRKEGGKE